MSTLLLLIACLTASDDSVEMVERLQRARADCDLATEFVVAAEIAASPASVRVEMLRPLGAGGHGIAVSPSSLAEALLFEAIERRDAAAAAEVAEAVAATDLGRVAGTYGSTLCRLARGVASLTDDPDVAAEALTGGFEVAMAEGWLPLATYTGPPLARLHLDADSTASAVAVVDALASRFRSPRQQSLFDSWQSLMTAYLADAPAEVFEPLEHAMQVFDAGIQSAAARLEVEDDVATPRAIAVFREGDALHVGDDGDDGWSTTIGIGVGVARDVAALGWLLRVRGAGLEILPRSLVEDDAVVAGARGTTHYLANGEVLRCDPNGRARLHRR